MQTSSNIHIFLLNPQQASSPCLVWAKDEATAKKDAASLIGQTGSTELKKGAGTETKKSALPTQCRELQFNKDFKVVQELGADRVEIEYKNQKITLSKDIAKQIH